MAGGGDPRAAFGPRMRGFIITQGTSIRSQSHHFIPGMFRPEPVPQRTQDLPADALQASAKSTTSRAFVRHPSLDFNVSTPKLIRFFDPDRACSVEKLSARVLTTPPIDLAPEPAQYDATESISTPNLTTDPGHVAPVTTNTDA